MTLTNYLPAKHPLKQAADGISLMVFFTLLWAVVAEIALSGRDYWLVGGLFLVILLVLLGYYAKFSAAARKFAPLSIAGGAHVKEEDPAKRKEGKRFLMVFISEAVAILLIRNILAGTGLDDYFIPCFALIVGLHFFPLARIFKRTFDYYVGTWTSLVAIAGIVLTWQRAWPPYLITALVAAGCALATSANGLRIVMQGNKLNFNNSIAIH